MSNQQSFSPDENEKTRSFKKRRKKPYIVQYKLKGDNYSLFLYRSWTKFGAYETLETAQEVLRQKSGDKYFEFRIKPDNE